MGWYLFGKLIGWLTAGALASMVLRGNAVKRGLVSAAHAVVDEQARDAGRLSRHREYMHAALALVEAGLGMAMMVTPSRRMITVMFSSSR